MAICTIASPIFCHANPNASNGWHTWIEDWRALDSDRVRTTAELQWHRVNDLQTHEERIPVVRHLADDVNELSGLERACNTT